MKQKEIFELIDKFENTRLAEIKIESENFRIILKSPEAVSRPAAAPPAAVPYPAFPPASAPPAAVPPADAPAPSPPEGSDTSGASGAAAEMITAPIVGTFYRSPAPDAPSFIEEGASVSTGDSIGIIEAMKIMNKLEAEFDCEILNILVENGEMVEFGTPLFEVRRT